jgi:hypothetical protein
MRLLLKQLDRLGEISRSDLSHAAKLELLCVQIGSLQFWTEQPATARRLKL